MTHVGVSEDHGAALILQVKLGTAPDISSHEDPALAVEDLCFVNGFLYSAVPAELHDRTPLQLYHSFFEL